MEQATPHIDGDAITAVKAQNNGHRVTTQSGAVHHCPKGSRFDPNIQAWVTGGGVIEPEETAAEKLTRLLGYAKQKRDNVERSGTVTITLGTTSVPFDADFNSLLRVGGGARAANRAVRAGAPMSIKWTDANGATQTLTAADLEALDDAIVARVQEAHGVYRQVKADIDAGLITTEGGIDSAPWPV